jgi:hypothetical protein
MNEEEKQEQPKAETPEQEPTKKVNQYVERTNKFNKMLEDILAGTSTDCEKIGEDTFKINRHTETNKTIFNEIQWHLKKHLTTGARPFFSPRKYVYFFKGTLIYVQKGHFIVKKFSLEEYSKIRNDFHYKKKFLDDLMKEEKYMQLKGILDNLLLEYIRKTGKKYTVYSRKGKRMGSYRSRKAAKKRLQQIEFFKRKK